MQRVAHCRIVCWLALALTVIAVSPTLAQEGGKGEEYPNFNYGQQDSDKYDHWTQSIDVINPDYRSKVSGETRITFKAPGMDTANAFCWQQPTDERPSKWGHDVKLTPGGIDLGDDGKGSFVLPADEFPYGPITVRILARNDEGQRDICELQLYNTGGVHWNLGIPDTKPPGAKGMHLVFRDDFERSLSISDDGRYARYNAHKPYFGDFSGWPFRDPDWEPAPPFEQIDTFLRIKARKPEGTEGGTGLIATVDMDGNGFWAKPPAYLEARFIAQSAPGHLAGVLDHHRTRARRARR
jgi:hypothetical protein